MNNNQYCVYKYTAPNGKCYIGITKQGVVKRAKRNGTGYNQCPRFWNAIKKYGWSNFKCEILFDNLRKDEAEQKEIEFISKLKSNDPRFGYNVDNGGNCCGSHSQETIEKISRANKGKPSRKKTEAEKKYLSERNSGKGNPFYGRHHTEFVKKEHSEFMKGNSYNKGNHHTDEFKRMKSEQMRKKYSNGGNPRCKKVVCRTLEGVVKCTYYSLRQASRETNIPLTKMYKIVNQNETYDNLVWGYVV